MRGQRTDSSSSNSLFRKVIGPLEPSGPLRSVRRRPEQRNRGGQNRLVSSVPNYSVAWRGDYALNSAVQRTFSFIVK